MKRIILAALAIGFSLSTHAALQKIDEENTYIAGNLNQLPLHALITATLPDLAKYIHKTDELRFGHVNHAQNLALSSEIESSAQEFLAALPQSGPGGLKIQIPGQVIHYGIIEMNMGDFTHPKNFGLGKLADLAK